MNYVNKVSLTASNLCLSLICYLGDAFRLFVKWKKLKIASQLDLRDISVLLSAPSLLRSGWIFLGDVTALSSSLKKEQGPKNKAHVWLNGKQSSALVCSTELVSCSVLKLLLFCPYVRETAYRLPELSYNC